MDCRWRDDPGGWIAVEFGVPLVGGNLLWRLVEVMRGYHPDE
ncbi:MAG: hypothetical protein RIT02_1373 [Planctomycetota bacterium]